MVEQEVISVECLVNYVNLKFDFSLVHIPHGRINICFFILPRIPYKLIILLIFFCLREVRVNARHLNLFVEARAVILFDFHEDIRVIDCFENLISRQHTLLNKPLVRGVAVWVVHIPSAFIAIVHLL